MVMQKGTRVQTQVRARTATYTNYKIIWVLIGLVAGLTVVFCYIITHILRFLENNHRNGERVKDLMRSRLYEQSTHH